MKLDKFKSMLNPHKLNKYKSMLHPNKLKKLGVKTKALYLAILFVSIICIVLITIINKNNYLSKLEVQAERHYFAQEYDLAIEKYINLAKENLRSPIWNAKIAEIYSLKRDLVSSSKYIDIVKKYEIISANTYASIVFTEFINGNYEGALKDGEIALSKYPKDKGLVKTMFTVYMGNNKIDEAGKIILSYPVDSKSSYDVAEFSRMLMLVDKWEEGYSELKHAFELNKDEYKIYDVLAQISLYNKDILLQNITDLSTKNPNELCYKMWLTKLYSLSVDTVDQANKLLSELSSKDVGNMQIKIIEANIYKNMGEIEKSDKLVQDVISKHPEDYRAYHSAGWYYLYKKDYKKAKEYCNKSIELSREYPDNYAFLMPEIIKIETSKLSAEPYFRTALMKEPYNYNIMLSFANYYWYISNDNEKALECFNLASVIKPHDPDIKYNTALIKLADDKAGEAIDILKLCIKFKESEPKYHRTLATIYMIQNNSEAAKVEIKNAYATDQEDVLTLNNAGCYYITFEQNLEKGLYNISKAYEGLKDNHDDYTKKTILENYDKIKSLKESYAKGEDNQEIKIPEFILFY